MSGNGTVDRILQSLPAAAPVDRATLTRLLSEKPATPVLGPLLNSHQPEVVGATLVYLSLYGSMRDCAVLALCLKHEDERVAALAEHCLWFLWMQSGSPEGNRELAAAIACVQRDDYVTAIDLLSSLVAREPAFAEAHFQRGLALCSNEETQRAAESYRQSLRLNPHHFGAAAALGHACVEQGNLPGALYYYRRALEIHPRLEDVPEALHEVESIVGAVRDARAQ